MRDWDDPKNEILGHTVTEVLMTSAGWDANEVVYLVTERGSVFEMRVSGECCSSSWWNDIYNVKQLLGGHVNDIAQIPMPDPTDDHTDVSVQAYGVRIKTNKGVCDFVFRNASNGYYGGYCTYKMRKPGEEIITVEDLTVIDEDWSA